MNRIIDVVFPCHKMLKKDKILGEIPANKTILRTTFDIAWPSAVESVLIALISAVDMMMVGSLGKEAISAVGIATQPRFLVLCLIFAINISVTVLVSRRKGEGKQAEANTYLRQALLVSVTLSFILCTLAIIFAREFLIFAGANSDYIDLAVPYFRILMTGNFFYAISLTITAAQRGAGNTKISMKTNLAANGVNVIFNALLIYGLFFFPRLEVTGAAIATAIGNVVALIIAVYSVTQKGGFLSLSFKDDWSLKMDKIRDIWNIAKSSAVEQVFIRFGFFTYSKAIAGLGTVDFSAHQLCMNIMHITFAIGDGMQVACTSLVGQSLGAKRSDMAMLYGKVSQRIGMILAIFTCIFLVLFKSNLIGLFSNDMEVLAASSFPMIILSVSVLFQIPQVIVVGSLRGAGDVKFVAIMMLISVSFIRPGLAYLLCYTAGLGLPGAWIALFLDQFTRFVLSFYRYHQGKWTDIVV